MLQQEAQHTSAWHECDWHLVSMARVLQLLHPAWWPCNVTGKRSKELLHRAHYTLLQGIVKSAGVSNFNIGHLDKLLNHAEIKPVRVLKTI
jgi:diketogulonate reductase-like aldo/keto reductase